MLVTFLDHTFWVSWTFHYPVRLRRGGLSRRVSVDRRLVRLSHLLRIETHISTLQKHIKQIYRRLNPPLRIGAPGNEMFSWLRRCGLKTSPACMMATECYVCKSDPSECINPAIQYCDKQRPWQCNFFITEECQGEENTLEKTLCCKCQNRLFDSVEIKEFKAHNVLCSSDNQVCGWSGTLGGLVDHRTDPKWQCKLKETLSVHHAAKSCSHHQTQTDSNCNMTLCH